MQALSKLSHLSLAPRAQSIYQSINVFLQVFTSGLNLSAAEFIWEEFIKSDFTF